MKKIGIGFLGFLAFFIFALPGAFSMDREVERAGLAQVAFQEFATEEMVFDDMELFGLPTRENLERIREMLERKDLRGAIRYIDRLLDGDNDVKIFTYWGIVYKKTDPNFRCGYRDRQRAIGAGEGAARNACLRAGYRRCRVVGSTIVTNGYLGTINGVYYGYGCKAESVVRGTN